jgi:hypothetical protein
MATLRFEGRDLSPYPEQVRREDLKEGDVYFSVRFFDRAMFVPALEPLVYVGSNLDPASPGLYFQDFDSHEAGATWQDQKGFDVSFDVVPEDHTQNIFEYDRALDLLLACSIRRRNRSDTGTANHERR